MNINMKNYIHSYLYIVCLNIVLEKKFIFRLTCETCASPCTKVN